MQSNTNSIQFQLLPQKWTLKNIICCKGLSEFCILGVPIVISKETVGYSEDNSNSDKILIYKLSKHPSLFRRSVIDDEESFVTSTSAQPQQRSPHSVCLHLPTRPR